MKKAKTNAGGLPIVKPNQIIEHTYEKVFE